MRKSWIALGAALLIASPAAWAGVEARDLPAASIWYFHADFEEMRTTEAGAGLYAWLKDEVFTEVREEVGIDLEREAERITAYATEADGAVLVLEGNLSRDTRDKALAAAAGAERFDVLEHDDKVYYYVEGDGEYNGDRVEVDGLDNELWFTFDVPGKLLIASKQAQLMALMDSGGRIAGSRGHDGALFVLSAEKSLVQAGMTTERFRNDDGGFDSNILRNTKQMAVMIADVAGTLSIDVQLVATEPKMAESLASIVRGLIALQAFSDDMDPDISEFLRGTRVDVDDTLLKVSVALAPDTLKNVLDGV